MRLSIERIRFLVLSAAALLLVSLIVLLSLAKWKSRFIRHDLPERLAKNIQQQAIGFTMAHAFGARSQYKIHASIEVQLRDNRVLLHGVNMELFGEDGSRVAQIAGDEFEYDKKSGLAIAVGPVEMVLAQPQSTAASAKSGKPAVATQASRQVHVKTSGVTFDQDTGVITTLQHVDFTMNQGSGSSMGATYDSQSGHLTLEQSVELVTQRGADTVKIHAQHAEFDRATQICWLRVATADDRGAQAKSALAKILFRPDGSAQQLDATGSFTLTTTTGGQIAAPAATMVFDEHSQPRHGHLQGGVMMDSVREGRTVHGTSPAADLEFAGQGQLRHAHLERGVVFTSDETSPGMATQPALHATRNWRSPVADVDFRDAGKGQVEPASLHGMGGVVLTSVTRRGNAVALPAKLVADDLTGAFGPNSSLSAVTGTGHAGIEQTTATGAQQSANGDRLQAQFAPKGETPAAASPTSGASAGANVQSAELDGHVVLFQQPTAKSGQPQPPLRATAGKAVYEGTGEWLHLTLTPRIENGGLELTADKEDVSQQSGDAFAHGNVKATWSGTSTGSTTGNSSGNSPGSSTGGATGHSSSAASGGSPQNSMTLGGNGPAHVIASEAQMNQSTGEATFRGRARLWQQANSVSAPLIILNQHAQTLVARTADPADPVRAVLLSAGGAPVGSAPRQKGETSSAKSATPSVIRVRGGDLWYSDAEHRAEMHAGALPAVVAETGTATSSSDRLELRLMPAGPGGAGAQVDRMTASGHVMLISLGRHGTGEQLLYSSVSGDYTLTGTASTPPRMTDPVRGAVTGQALIFHSRDDSVSIEGGGQQTTTQTTAPDAHGK